MVTEELGGSRSWSIQRLASRDPGRGPVDLDVPDEHERWQMYHDAIKSGDHELVLAVVAGEPVQALVRAVVWEVVEVPELRPRALNLLPEGPDREDVLRHIGDLEMRAQMRSGDCLSSVPVSDMSIFLQRACAVESECEELLQRLADSGTRRVRHEARWRLSAVDPQGSR
ncbi:hypothetical protein [Actinotalea sp. C106]|uniref:hypothetical protein n=1 Tax=Actinotalea sp. C106 TaxID=2908644 RepID=UPI0020293CFB|nr:hypothetical protein [Actinotalea sp. C106]